MQVDLDEIRKYNAAKVVAIDTETTGLKPGNDEVLSLSVVDVRLNPLFDRLVKPTRRKRWPEAQRVNGIAPSDVANEKTLVERWPELAGYFDGSCLIVGYNVQYDLDMLRASGLRIGDVPAFDVMDAVRELVGRRIKLVNCARAYGYGEFDAHGACEDAKATMYCFLQYMRGTPLDMAAAGVAPSKKKAPHKGADARNHTNVAATGPLAGEVVCITGECQTMTRDALMEYICSKGGTPSNNVTLKTTILVDFGGDSTRKREKAVEYGPRTGIRILSGSQFFTLVSGERVAAPVAQQPVQRVSPRTEPVIAQPSEPSRIAYVQPPESQGASANGGEARPAKRNVVAWIAFYAAALVTFSLAALFATGVVSTPGSSKMVVLGLTVFFGVCFVLSTIGLWRQK